MNGIRAADLLQYVIKPTLVQLQLGSEAAENLLLGTAAQESQLGHYLQQINGPARGIYQMEPATHDDIWDNFLAFKPDLGIKINCLIPLCIAPGMRYKQLTTNLAYSTAMARVHYLRVSDPLPPANDINGLAKYWKLYYNTTKGKGKVEDFVKNYERYIK